MWKILFIFAFLCKRAEKVWNFSWFYIFNKKKWNNMTKMILIFTFHVKNRNIENVIDFCILCVENFKDFFSSCYWFLYFYVMCETDSKCWWFYSFMLQRRNMKMLFIFTYLYKSAEKFENFTICNFSYKRGEICWKYYWPLHFM